MKIAYLDDEEFFPVFFSKTKVESGPHETPGAGNSAEGKFSAAPLCGNAHPTPPIPSALQLREHLGVNVYLTKNGSIDHFQQERILY